MTERRKKLVYLLALLGGRTRRRGVGYDYLARILGAITMCIATGLYAAFEALIRYRFPSEGWGLTLIFVPIGVFYIFFFERLFLERILRAVRLTKKQSWLGWLYTVLLLAFAVLFLYLMTKWRDLVT